MKTQAEDNSKPLSDGFNFTPIYRGQRVRMRISTADLAATNRRGTGVRGIVTDLDTGKTYKVHGRSCGLPNCQCDAEIKDCSEPSASDIRILGNRLAKHFARQS